MYMYRDDTSTAGIVQPEYYRYGCELIHAHAWHGYTQPGLWVILKDAE